MVLEKDFFEKLVSSCAEHALVKVCSLSLMKSVGIFNGSSCKAVWFFNGLADKNSHPVIRTVVVGTT